MLSLEAQIAKINKRLAYIEARMDVDVHAGHMIGSSGGERTCIDCWVNLDRLVEIAKKAEEEWLE